jgi:signal peptidase
MIYKGLGLITNTESPIVVVLRCVDLFVRHYALQPPPSGSMEPAFYRGDILFLTNPPNTRYEIGDITVYKIPGQDIPIVHRILETHDVVKVVNGSVFFTRLTTDGSELTAPSLCSVRESKPRPENQLLLTKGDNNYLDDVELYQGLDWLERKHIVGKVRGCVSKS